MINKDVKKVGYVYETKDYSLFEKLVGNRVIMNSPKLRDDLLENGQEVPIVVNDKMEILDGQHRLVELKRLSLPVKFVVSDSKKKTSVISINTTQRNWNNSDFLKFYADNGYNEYQQLERFYNNNKLSLKLCIAGGAGKRAGGLPDVAPLYRKGAYVFSNQEQLQRFSNFSSRLENETMYDLTEKENEVLWTMFTVGNFDEDRMVDKFLSKNMKSDLFGVRDEPTLLRIMLTGYLDRLQEDSPLYINHSYTNSGKLVITR